MRLKYRIISGAIWNAINSSASLIISVGTVAVLARLLEPEDFGMYAMIAIVMNILDAFADMGVSSAIISYRDVTHDELNSLFYLNLAIGIGLTLLVFAISPVVVYYYKEPKIYTYLWILALNFVLTSPATIFNVLLKKEMKFAALSKINMAATLVYSIVTIVLAYFTRSIICFVIGALAQSTVTTVCNIYVGLKTWKPGGYSLKYKNIKRFLSFGLYQMGSRIVLKFNWNIDYLLIGRYLGAEMLGYYSLAYDLMMKPIQRINPIFNSVAFPALSEIQDDAQKLKLYFLKMIRYVVYIMGPLYLLFFVLSEPLIRFFYGDKWLLSVPVLAVFAFLGILRSIGNPIGNLILAKGRADIGFWWTLFQTLFLLAANYIGLRWGILGVALSTLTVSLFLFFPLGFFLRSYLAKISPSEYLHQLKSPLLFSFSAASIILVLQKYAPVLNFTAAPFYSLALYTSVFFIIYISLLTLFDRDELGYLWKTLKEYVSDRKSKN